WSGGSQSSTLLVNCTVVHNQADSDGDGQGAGGGIAAAGPVWLFNTIVAGNVRGPDELADDIDGTIGGSRNHNLIGVGTDTLGVQDGANGNQVGTLDHPLDPRLGPLQDNGGPTWTLAPLAGSPVLDAGNNADASATDQRGLTRIVGSAIDIGA